MDYTTFIEEPARRTPVVETDVFVAGGGTAGCVAAIAAARQGARVILVEKLPVPGGTYTNGGIGTNNFFSATEDPAKSRRIVGGLGYELTQRLMEAGGATGFLPSKNDHYRQPYRFAADHEVYKGVISEMLREAGVKVLLQSFVCDVIRDGTRLDAVILENKNGRNAVRARQYIDATGDGDLARLCGLTQTTHWQDYDKVCGGPTGLVFGMAGIDVDKVLKENPKAAHALGTDAPQDGSGMMSRRFVIAHGADQERYKPLCDLPINYFTNFQCLHEGDATYINNSAGVKADCSDAEALSDAEMEMRIRIMKMAKALRDTVPGFEHSYLSWASVQLGIRSSKVTVCDVNISQEDISAGRRFEDEIGLYAFHDFAPKHPELFPKDPGFYGFPYRMLLPVGADNLYMAGRCVTTDIKAHMSTRNVVGCWLMGQGAGVAAALCAGRSCGSRELPYPVLREALLSQDVILE